MNDPKNPEDPITPLMESAVQTHELFTSYTIAGFTRKEALYLTGRVLAAIAGTKAAGGHD